MFIRPCGCGYIKDQQLVVLHHFYESQIDLFNLTIALESLNWKLSSSTKS